MRIALSASLAPFIGRREAATLSSSFGLTFTGGQEEVARQLKAAFRCAKPGAKVVSGSPDIRVVSNGHTGFLSLQAFQRLGGAVTRHVAAAPVSVRQAWPEQQAEVMTAAPDALPPVGPAGNVLQQIQNIVRRAVCGAQQWSDQEQSQFLGTEIRSWQERVQDAFTARKQHALQLSLKHRTEAMQALHQGLAELRQIEQSAGPRRYNRVLFGEVGKAHQRLLRLLLETTYPGLQVSLPETGNLDLTLPRLSMALVALEKLLRRAGGSTEQFCRVIEALAGFGRAAEFLNTPQADLRARGVEGLTAVIETVLAATRVPHDGAALCGLLGLDNEIDDLILTVRKQAAERFLLRAAATAEGVRVAQLVRATRTSCLQVASDIARQDGELAHARQRLRVALQKAGVAFTMTGLNGIRVDANLVAALRAKQRKNPLVPEASLWGLGKKAPDVGVIVAGLLALERSALQSPAREKMREAIVQLMADIGPRCRSAQVKAGQFHKLLEEARLTLAHVHHRASLAQSAEELAANQAAFAEAKRDIERFSRAFHEASAESNKLRVLQTRLDSLAETRPGSGTGEDAQRYLDAAQTGGLTEKELTQLGLTREEAVLTLGGVKRLMDQGVSSAKQAANAVHAVTLMFDRLGNRAFLGDTALMKVFLQGGSNEHRAGLFADVLARQLSGQMDVRRNAALPALLAARFGDQFQGRFGDLLSVSRGRYHSAEQRLLSLAAELQTLNEEGLQHARALTAFNERRRVPVRISDPNVVAAALQLQKAYRLTHNAASLDALSAEDRKQLKKYCHRLRGFDAQTMSLPKLQWPGSAVAELALFEYLKKPDIAGAIKNIVFLADQAKERRRHLEAQTNETLLAMDQLLRERSLELGQGSIQLRDLMRLAVLSTLQAAHAAGTSTVAEFSPVEHAEEIRAWLQAAGVDTQLFAPELRRFLAESFGPDELNLWAQTTLWTKDAEQALKQSWAEESAALREADARGGLKPQTKAALLRQLDELSVGACMEVTLRASLELESPYVPVTPGIGVIATASGSAMSMVEIFRGADVYELLIRHGGEATLGFGVRAKATETPEIGSTLDATADIGAGLYVMPGVSLRFAGGEAGLAQLKQFLEKAMTQRTITAMDLAGVEQVIPVVETKPRGTTSLGLRASVDPFGKDVYWKSDARPPDWAPYPRFRAHASVDANIGYMLGDYGNTNKTIYKREKDMTVALSTSAALNLKVAIPGATDQVTGTHMAHLGAAATVYYRRKHAEVRGADRLLQAATQFSREMHPPPLAGRAAILTMGGALFQSVMEDPRLDPKIKEAVEGLIAAAGVSDKIRVCYALDEPARGYINRLLSQARALREGRTPSLGKADAARRAAALEAEAKALIDHDANYYPVKLMLMPANSRRHQLSFLNLGFVHWTTTTDTYTDQVALEVKLDVGLVRTVRAEQNEQTLRQQ